MHRLLVVDDEPIIVEGLYELFRDMIDLDLEVHRAYSSTQALELVARIKFDLVFTDIRMPGMDGLDLHKHIVSRWPGTRVVFLTGYNDFQYAQQAIRAGGYDFIIKTEGEEKILEVFYRAIQEIACQWDEERLKDAARRQIQQAIPLLQKEYILALMEEDIVEQADARAKRLEELNISLDSEQSLLLMTCRVDRWYEDMTHADKTLLLYAIQNISDELLQYGRKLSLVCSSKSLMWMLQPKEQDNRGGEEEFLNYVKEIMVEIHDVCKNLLRLPVSLFLSGGYTSWNDIGRQYGNLLRREQNGIGQNEEVLLIIESKPDATENRGNQMNEEGYYVYTRKLKQLEAFLETGQKLFFLELFHTLSTSLQPLWEFARQHFFHSVSAMLLDHVNCSANSADLLSMKAVSAVLNAENERSWEEKCSTLIQLAQFIFDYRVKDQTIKSIEMIDQLKQYIGNHLKEDLSLTKLSSIVYLNASYLSRFFKQMTGVNVSEFILELRMEKAMELIKETDLKIQEVADEVGIGSSAYFIRLFKNRTKMTPMEYRESI